MSGEVAALSTAFLFSITSIFFTLAGRRYGAIMVMQGTLLVGVFCVMGLHLLFEGQLLPVGAESWRWIILSVSGVVGLIGSAVSVIQAFVLIGPRITNLITALTPAMGAFLAWLFLGESIGLQTLLGMSLTISGVFWVISDHSGHPDDMAPAVFKKGLGFAFLAAVAQATAFVLSRQGMTDDFPAISGSLMRIIAAVSVLWGLALLRGKIIDNARTYVTYPVSMGHIGIAALVGPVSGMTMVMLALQRSPVGIVSTLSNLTPIIMLPIGYFVFHETITRRAIIGTMVAVVGTSVLFLG